MTTEMMGRVAGGWEYVWAAYVVTWLFFAGYALSLWLRWKQPPEDR